MSDDTTRIITKKPTYAKDEKTASRDPGIGADSLVEPMESRYSTQTAEADMSDTDSETRIFRPKSKKATGKKPEEQVDDYIADPVVGWLVVISGPGKGSSHELGYGMNSIGRSADDRISINFGDDQISRFGHAQLTYDPKGRTFYIQHGGGTNLTYLGKDPVLQPAVLKGGETIGIGETVLKFVPLCGPKFEWQDN